MSKTLALLPRNSLNSRIILTTLVVFLASLWSLSYYTSRMLRQDMERLLREQQSSTVSMIAHQVNRELGDRLGVLETVATLLSPTMGEGAAAAQTLIERRPDLHALFNLGVFVMGTDGTAIADFPITAGRKGVNFAERDFLTLPVNEGKTTIGRPVIGKVTHAPVFVMAAPVRDAQGKVAGVLGGVTSLGVPNFLDQVTESHYGQTGGYLLVAPQHRLIVTASDKSRVMEALPDVGLGLSIDRLIAEKEWFAVTSALHDGEAVVSSKAIPVAGWQAVAMLPVEEAFAPIRDMQRRMLYATLFLTLLAGWLSWWMLRRQLSPLVETAGTLAAMSEGRQPLKPLDIARHDEIGQLIGGFNHLLATLGERETALRESEARLQTLIHAFPDLIWLKSPDGVYLACNQRFERFFGKAEKEIVGRTDYDFVDRELADFFREHDRIAMAKGAPSVNQEWITFADDGHRELLETTKIPMRDVEGCVVGVFGIGHDITESKRLEGDMARSIDELKTLNRRLEETQNQLVQAEKMSAVGQLAAGVAHEINNPVGFVNSNLGTLRIYVNDMVRLIDAYRAVADACPPGHPALARVDALGSEIGIDFLRDDVVALLGESLDGLERVKRIVADLKDFSRVGESEWQLANVHKCLDSTLNVVANELKYKATVLKQYGELPEIRCMPFQLNQVFMNLLVNAAHAIKERGTITVRTGSRANTVWIEVEDDGAGIAVENLDRIFDPFFTTKPVGSGTGLGLSVSYGIIRKHQGRIEVCSEPGKGTVFHVTLPIDPTPADEAQNVAS